jgi:hypothetical protein
MNFNLNNYPHPNLPPRGKEYKTFPPWGEMKGGKYNSKIVTIMLKNYTQEEILSDGDFGLRSSDFQPGSYNKINNTPTNN